MSNADIVIVGQMPNPMNPPLGYSNGSDGIREGNCGTLEKGRILWEQNRKHILLWINPNAFGAGNVSMYAQAW